MRVPKSVWTMRGVRIWKTIHPGSADRFETEKKILPSHKTQNDLRTMAKSHKMKRTAVMALANNCEPPAKKTYLTIGQDLFAIEGYLREQYNYSLHQYLSHHNATVRDKHFKARDVPVAASVVPAAFMVYTDIQTLRGLGSPIDYGSGIEYASGLLQESISLASKNTALQIGLWLNGTAGTRDIVAGRVLLQDNIRALVRYIHHCPAGTVFLRVGYEFDNPGFHYADDPASYQAAYRIIVDACRQHELCRKKTVFVWHSWAAGLPGDTKLGDFYPGDDHVDWIGVSLFQQFYANVTGAGSLDTVTAVLDFAREHDKPTMIAESTPFGGIDSLVDPWNDWYQPCLDLIDAYDISMWSYINCAWDTQPMWRYVGFGDTRLSTNATVMNEWNRKVLQNPRFLLAGSVCQTESSSHETTGLLLLFDSKLAFLGGSHQASPPIYLAGAIVIALMGICFRFLCVSSANHGTEYAALADDGENGIDHVGVKHNRTGYGTIQ